MDRAVLFRLGALSLVVCLSALTFTEIQAQVQQRGELAQSYEAAQLRLAEVEERVARLEQSGTRSDWPDGVAWSSASVNEASQDLQKAVLQNLNKAGLEATRFGGSYRPDNVPVAAIGLDLEFEGALRNVSKLLMSLRSNEPAIAVGSLQIRHVSSRTRIPGETPVSVRMGLWGVFEASR